MIPKSTSARREQSWFSDFFELQDSSWREIDCSVSLCETHCICTTQYIVHNHHEWNKLQTATQCITFNLCFPCQLSLYRFAGTDWRISLWIGKAKRKKGEGELFYNSVVACLLCCLSFKVPSSNRLKICIFWGWTTHRHTHKVSVHCICKLQQALSSCTFWRRLKTMFPSLHQRKQQCNWDSRFKLRETENFFLNLLH